MFFFWFASSLVVCMNPQLVILAGNQCFLFDIGHLASTHPETNSSPTENRPSQQEIASSNHPIFRGYVSFREGRPSESKTYMEPENRPLGKGDSYSNHHFFGGSMLVYGDPPKSLRRTWKKNIPFHGASCSCSPPVAWGGRRQESGWASSLPVRGVSPNGRLGITVWEKIMSSFSWDFLALCTALINLPDTFFSTIWILGKIYHMKLPIRS